MIKHLLFLSFALISCSTSSIDVTKPCDPVKTSGQILPLKIGNTWVYHIEEIEFGTIKSSTYDTLTITHDTLINNETWFFYLGDIVTNRSDGLWSLYQIKKDSAIPILRFPYPTKVGNVIPAPYDSGVVFATDTIISVPLGCFSANVYFVQTKKEYSDCFVPGVGKIKWEQWYNGFEHHDLIKKVELVSSKLN